MIRREKLLEQWNEVRKKIPEDEVLDIKSYYGGISVVYSVADDALRISQFDEDRIINKAITLSGDEAEKLYNFLGGLYGNHV
jgi:hypothetical protein